MDKQIISSSTVQGILILFLAGIKLFLGVEILPDEAKIIEDSIMAIILCVGTVRAIVGRVKANRNLKFGGFKL
mgnify:CR=1 FL=1